MLEVGANYFRNNSCLKIRGKNSDNIGYSTLDNLKNDQFVKTSNATNSIAFTGWKPGKKNLPIVTQIVNLIKSETVKTIALLGHRNPVGDEIGEALGLQRMIKKATGKKPDVFIQKPLPQNLNFLDPYNKKITVLTKTDAKGRITQMNANEIKKKYGNYDLVIVCDTPTTDLLDKPLRHGILQTARNTVKIDHHPVPTNPELSENFNYADINFVDPRESGSQVAMQFVKPLGLKPKKIVPSITEPLLTGLMADTGEFMLSKSPHTLKDAAKLQKTADINKITNKLNAITPDEYKIYLNLTKEINFSENGKIAYLVIDKSKYPVGKGVIVKILEDLNNIEGLKYYFSVTKDPNNGKTVVASIKSKAKPVLGMIRKLGGNGHDTSGAVSTTKMSSDEMVSLITKELNKLENNILPGAFEHGNKTNPQESISMVI